MNALDSNSTARVVITGMGVQSPLGDDAEVFFGRLCAGKSGIRVHPNQAIQRGVGWVDFDATKHFNKLELMSLDRVSQLSIVAAAQAVHMAGLDDEAGLQRLRCDDVGVYMGTGAGGIQTLEDSYAQYFSRQWGAEAEAAGSLSATKKIVVPAAMIHAPASQVALRFGVTGECQTYSTACSSSSVAIGEAYRRIRFGWQNMAIAGGADCLLSPGVLNSWEALRVLCDNEKGCQPFSAGRTGFAMGEGAAIFVMERLDAAIARGATIFAELVGYGVSNDASHITKPSSKGQVMAMQRALADAKLPNHAVGYINAHGTATQAGDAAETASIKAVFPHCSDMPVSATKSSHGHLMGASGAIELLATIQALRHQLLPPTLNYGTIDPDCDLDCVPNTSRAVSDLNYAMSNSFAFGGNNAVLIAKRWQGVE